MRKHMWKTVTLILAVGLGLLCGCGKEGGTTLRVANWAGPEEIAIEEANLAGFRTAHPDVRVTLEPIPRPGEYKQKILTSIAGGTAPDVLLLDAIHVPQFIAAGALLDLRTAARRHGLDLNTFYPQILSVFERGERLYAVPKDFTPMVMYYNRSLFAAAGVAPPADGWSWEEFLAKAQALTADLDGDGQVDRYGTTVPAEFHTWSPWIWSNGGDYLAADGQRATGYLNGDATVEALTFLLDLSQRHGVAPGHARLQSLGGELAMFLAGRSAMAESGHWWMPQISDASELDPADVGVVAIPAPEGGQHETVFFAAGWAVWNRTQHPELAVRLALHLGSREASRRRAASGVAIPARQPLALELAEKDNRVLEAQFLREIPFARAPWGARVPHADILEEAAAEAFAAAWLQGRGLRHELDRAAHRVDAELQRRR